MSAIAETARDVIDRIRRNDREREYCLAVLDLWAQVQEQGIEIERVASFGFDRSILTEGQKRVWRFHQSRRSDDPYVEKRPNGGYRLKVYNYVRHHDGGITRLDPMLEAVYERDDS
jgi:hypothetical protein